MRFDNRGTEGEWRDFYSFYLSQRSFIIILSLVFGKTSQSCGSSYIPSEPKIPPKNRTVLCFASSQTATTGVSLDSAGHKGFNTDNLSWLEQKTGKISARFQKMSPRHNPLSHKVIWRQLNLAQRSVGLRGPLLAHHESACLWSITFCHECRITVYLIMEDGLDNFPEL